MNGLASSLFWTVGFFSLSQFTFGQAQPGESCAAAIEISVTETQTNFDPNDPFGGVGTDDCVQFTEPFDGGCSSSFLGDYGVIYEYNLGDEPGDFLLGDCISFVGASVNSSPFGMFLMDGCPSDPNTSCIASKTFTGNIDYGVLGPLNLPKPETYYLVVSVADAGCAGGNCPGFRTQVVRSNETAGEFGCSTVTQGSTCKNAINVAGLPPGGGTYTTSFDIRGSRDDFDDMSTCSGYANGEDFVLDYRNMAQDVCVDFTLEFLSANPAPVVFYISQGCPGGVGSYCVERYDFSGSQNYAETFGTITLQKGVEYFFVVEETAGNVDENIIDFRMDINMPCDNGVSCDNSEKINIGQTISTTVGPGVSDVRWNRYFSGYGYAEAHMEGDNVLFELSSLQDTCVNIILDNISDQVGSNYFGEVVVFDGCVSDGTFNNVIASGRCEESFCQQVAVPTTLTANRIYTIVVSLNPQNNLTPLTHFTGSFDLTVESLTATDPELICDGCQQALLDDCKTCFNGGLENFSSAGWNFFNQDDPAAPLVPNFEVLEVGVNNFDRPYSLVGNTQNIPRTNFAAVADGEYALAVGGFDYPLNTVNNCNVTDRCNTVRRDIQIDSSNARLAVDYAFFIEGNADGDVEEEAFGQLYLTDGLGALIPCNNLHYSPGYPLPAGFTAGTFTNTVSTANVLQYDQVVYPLLDYLGQTVTVNMKVCDSEFKENQALGFIEFSCGELPYKINPDTACFGDVVTLEAPTDPNISNYVWADGSTGKTKVVDSTDVYSVTITYFGCEYTIDYPVFFKDDLLFDISLFPICPEAQIDITNNTILPLTETVLLWKWNLDEAQDPLIESNIAEPSFSRQTAGNYQIEVELISNFGCTYDSVILFTVDDPFVIDLTIPDPYCPLDESFRIADTLLPNPTGGTFYRDGNSAIFFNPGSETPGYAYDYVYQITDPVTGCVVEKEFQLGVLDTLEIQFTPLPTFCRNEDSIQLNIAAPSGGIYSGDGVFFDGTDYYINPSEVTFLNSDIIYEVVGGNGCSNIDTINFDIEPVPNVFFFEPFDDICSNDDTLDLTGGRPNNNPAQQYYSGTGVQTINSIFIPKNAGAGTHTIKYAYTDPVTGCYDEAFADITVLDTALLVLDPNKIEVCREVEAFAADFVSPLGGIYSGLGIVGGGTFDPSLIPSNVYSTELQYSYQDPVTQCVSELEFTVYLFDHPVITFPPFTDVCENADPLNLSGAGPSGGNYSGFGVTNNVFDPSIGSGQFDITYTVTNGNGCASEAVEVLTVLPKPPGVSFDPVAPVCDQEDPYTLVEGSPAGGMYYGDGVVNGTFDPQGASTNPQEIFYLYVDPASGCSDTVSQFVEIFNEGLIFAGDDVTTCVNAAPFNPGLGNEFPSGGSFSGPFMTSGQFDPEAAGPGTYRIFYAYTSSDGCGGVDSLEILVRNPPSVSQAALPTLCVNNEPTLLTGGSPSGGVYSGFGVVGGSQFDPSLTGAGSFQIYYRLTDAFGCFNEDSVMQNVSNLPSVQMNQSAVGDICTSESPFDLTTFGANSPVGGSFLGSFISGNVLDASGLEQDSNFVARYVYVDPSSGCSDTAQFNLSIIHPETPLLLSADTVCPNEAPFTLQSSLGGGSFSGAAVTGGNTFNPNLANFGEQNTINFTGTSKGCPVNDAFEIFVHFEQALSHDTILPVCLLGGPIRLEGGHPTGGSYSGIGVSNSDFYPAQADTGIHTLNYHYTDANGCDWDHAFQIKVEEGEVTLDFPVEICKSEPKFTLNSGTPGGGEYYIDGVQVVEMDPSLYDPGTHAIRYIAPGSGGSVCMGEDNLNFEILEAPVLSFPNYGVVCEKDPDFPLNQASPTGGTYRVDGTLQSAFSPSTVGPGSYEINYTLTDASGCTSSLTRTLVVSNSPDVTAGVLEEYCANQTAVSLEDGLPAGGTYGGVGYDNTSQTFDPSFVGPGTHGLYYIFTNLEGCADSALTNVEVRPDPNVSLDTIFPLCLEADPVVLNQGNGPVSGTSVEAYFINNGPATSFVPKDHGVGDHILEYRFEDGNCLDTAISTVRVLDEPAVTIANFPLSICENASAFTLAGSSPDDLNGSYSIEGTAVSQFDPSIWGVGKHTIVFDYSDGNGCLGADSTEIEVLEIAPEQVIPQNDICWNGAPVILNQGSPEGVFSGTGVLPDGLTFDPSMVPSAGLYNLEFSETHANGCITLSDVEIQVLDEVVVAFANHPGVCVDGAVEPLAPYGSPAGGDFYFQNWQLPGNQFDPAYFGAGTHNLEYRIVSANGCEGIALGSVTVYDLPNPTLVGFPVICNSGPYFNLTQGLPAGGEYRVDGQVVPGFMPADLGPGNHNVDYTYTDGNGCAKTVQGSFEISPDPVVTVNDQPDVCLDGGVFNLVFGSPNNGIFTGPGVVNQKDFDPSITGLGTFNLNYEITSDVGCPGTAISEIRVIDGSQILFTPNLAFCQNDSVVDLNDEVQPKGGVFSIGGQPLTNGIFNPGNYAPGTYTIDYDFQSNNGCENQGSTSIEVLGLPTVSISDPGLLCDHMEPLALDMGAPVGGNYFLDGTAISQLDPAIWGPGSFQLAYEVVGSNGCLNSDSVGVEIYDYPELVFPTPVPSCLNNPPFNWAGATPPGGDYAGPGTVDNVFTPSDAGTGFHTIWYTFATSAGCLDSIAAVIEVFDSANVAIGPFEAVCENSSPFILPEGTPSGGVYSGAGINSGVFDPKAAGSGVQTITYTWNDGGNCGGIAENTIEVFPFEELIQYSFPEVCTNAEPLLLDIVSPTGGTYVGPTVSNNYFDPAGLSPGTYQVEYFFSNIFGCVDSLEVDILVLESPVVNQIAQIETCPETDTLNLYGGTPVGGYYEGPAVMDSSYMLPITLGPGNYDFYYHYTNAQGCSDSLGAILTIFDKPVVTFDQSELLCLQADSVELVGGNPTGGDYFGPGVVDGYFYPEMAGNGDHVLTYIYADNNGCVDSAQTQFSVTPDGAIGIDPLADICLNEGPRVLTEGYPAGGSYSGTGVVNGSFDPELAGLGVHTIYYAHSTSQGCNSQVSETILVRNIPNVQFPVLPEACEFSDSIVLTGGVPYGGTYWGPGVQFDSIFYPDQIGEGSFELVYGYTDEHGCMNSDTSVMVVFPSPIPAIDAIANICLDGSPVELTTGTPAGGVYSGPGISNGWIFPELAGPGQHTYFYSYTDNNGCEGTASANFEVIPRPIVAFEADSTVCVGDAPYVLNGGTPEGGVYTGESVVGGVFEHAGLPAGDYRMVYTFTSPNGCVDSAEHVIQLRDLPVVSLGNLSPVCANQAPFDLYGGSPIGGTYTGSGVVNNELDPAFVGAGTHWIYYTYTESWGCSARDSASIVVHALPQVSFSGEASICENADPILLSTGIPSGGVYTGPGVSNNFFYPDQTGPGNFTLTYGYTDGNGCYSESDTRITVEPAPVVTLDLPNIMCADSDPVFMDFGTPAGGVYSGPGIYQGSFYSDSVSFGIQKVIYTFQDANGCTGLAEDQWNVRPNPELVVADTFFHCLNGGLMPLDQASPAGGIWSGLGVSNNAFDPNLTGSGVFEAYYSFTDAFGCNATDTSSVRIWDLPAVSFGPVPAICASEDSVILTQGFPLGGSYEGPFVTDSIFWVRAVSPGIHNLEYITTSAQGCTDTARSSIEVLANPGLPGYTSNSPVCLGQTVMLNAQGGGNMTFSWVGPNSFTSSNANVSIPNAQPLHNGQYGLISFDGNCLSDTTWVPVGVIEAPSNVVFDYNVGICELDTLVLTADSLPGIRGYYHMDGTLFEGYNQVITPAREEWNGNAFLILDGGTCFADSLPLDLGIRYSPELPLISSEVDICLNDTLLAFVVNQLPNETVSWETPIDTLEADFIQYNPFTSEMEGVYRAQLISKEGCVGPQANQAVYYREIPAVNLPDDTVFCSEVAIFDLEIPEWPEIRWTMNGWDISGASDQTSIPITTAGLYEVFVTDNFGCIGSDSIRIDENCPPDIYIPNSFTPNDDDLNDGFFPVLEKPLNFVLRIFDRWGHMVYEGDQNSLPWDGNYRGGKACRPDTYIWVLIFDENGDGVGDQSARKTGNVTLVR